MAAIHPAIQTYLDLATPQMMADSWAVLERGMRQGHLLFGDRLLSNALRPQLVTVQEWQAASQMSATLVSAFDKAYQAMLIDPALRAQVWLTPEEEIIVGYEAGVSLPVPIGRLDCSLIHNDSGEPSLHLLEYNAESPAAIAYEDGLAEVFLQTPLLHAFQQRYPIRPLWAKPAALQTLLSIYREWGGRSLPTVAIVDWTGLPTQHEFMLFQEYFTHHGIRTVIVEPDAMTYESGVLYANGVAVDFVYKRILTHELLGRYGIEHPLIYAVRDRAVCMMNRFSCKLLHKKASLALLSDEQNAHLFSREEQAAIQRHIPWTRRVEERMTWLDDAEIDLLPFIAANQERLVLKPNDEYGGKGVVLGWDVSQAQWQQATEEALRQPSVVQLRVPLGQEQFPVVLPDGSFAVQPRLVDFDPFIFDGHYAGGCLTRLSAGGLLNVTAGGGTTTPTMVVAV
jgi:hypothetical protein